MRNNQLEIAKTSPGLRRIFATSLLLAVLMVTTACTPGTTESDRDAGAFFNKMKVCVQNMTSSNLEVSWDSYMQNDQGNYLAADQLNKSLSPSASDCAISYAWLGAEFAELSIGGHVLEIENTRGTSFPMTLNRQNLEIQLNTPLTRNLSGAAKPSLYMEAFSDGALKKFNTVEAYSIDIRVYDPR